MLGRTVTRSSDGKDILITPAAGETYAIRIYKGVTQVGKIELLIPFVVGTLLKIEDFISKITWVFPNEPQEGEEYEVRGVSVDANKTEKLVMNEKFVPKPKAPAPTPPPQPPQPGPQPGPQLAPPTSPDPNEITNLTQRLDKTERDLTEIELGFNDYDICPDGKVLRDMHLGLADIAKVVDDLMKKFTNNATLTGLYNRTDSLGVRIEKMNKARRDMLSKQSGATPQSQTGSQARQTPPAPAPASASTTPPTKWEKFWDWCKKENYFWLRLIIVVILIGLALWFIKGRIERYGNTTTDTSSAVSNADTKHKTAKVIYDPPKSGNKATSSGTPVSGGKTNVTVSGNPNSFILVNQGSITGGNYGGGTASKVWPEGFEAPELRPMLPQEVLDDMSVTEKTVRFTIEPYGEINVDMPAGWIISLPLNDQVKMAFDIRKNPGDPCKWILNEYKPTPPARRCWVLNKGGRDVVVTFTLKRGFLR